MAPSLYDYIIHVALVVIPRASLVTSFQTPLKIDWFEHLQQQGVVTYMPSIEAFVRFVTGINCA